MSKYTEVLTEEERWAWEERDVDSYDEWVSRMIFIEIDELSTGKKVPRHRMNKKNPSEP